MNKKINIIVAAIIILVLLLASSVYKVNERQVAVVTQFKRLVKTEQNAGIKFKLPFIQDVEYFDARMQRLDVDPELFLTNEKKYLVVDYFVIWRIGNIREFYTSVQGDLNRASRLIDQLVKDGLRSEFVLRSVKDVISEDRSSIMDSITQSLHQDAQRYGVDIIGVRLKRVDFSDDIRDRVFERMRAERERVSKELRAQGQEKSAKIRAAAERDAEGIIAQAREKSSILRGEADAQAAELYAKHYGQDLDFYQFWRSMQNYRESMKGNNTTLILSPDSEFFRYFHDTEGRSPLVNKSTEQVQSVTDKLAVTQQMPLSPKVTNPIKAVQPEQDAWHLPEEGKAQ